MYFNLPVVPGPNRAVRQCVDDQTLVYCVAQITLVFHMNAMLQKHALSESTATQASPLLRVANHPEEPCSLHPMNGA